MKVIYIAGPFRAPNAWEVEKNIRKAEEAAFAVAKRGYAFICPHTNSRFFNGTRTAEYWLEMTMELMRRCDGVLFVDGWMYSEGSEAEHKEAEKARTPDLLRSRGSARAMSKMGLEKGKKQVPRILGQCIDLLRPLPRPVRAQILQGLRTFCIEDVCLVDHGEDLP